MNQRHYLRILCCLFSSGLVCISLMASSQPARPAQHSQLEQAAEQWVSNQLGVNRDGLLQVSSNPIDPRVTVPPCPAAMQFTASQHALQQSHIAVKASCSANNWYLYMMVKTRLLQEVVVLTDTLSPGTLLTRDNLKVVEMDQQQLRGSTYQKIDTLLGARLKRRMRMGQPLSPGQLCFVCKGDNIVISAISGGLAIKTTGVAEQDGNLGDTIRVRNSKSQRLLSATVSSIKQVVVNI